MSSPYCQPCEEKRSGIRHKERCRVPACANYARDLAKAYARKKLPGLKGIVGA